MTTLSTHDTKRSEDVRARLAVLAEIPGRVGATVPALGGRATRCRTVRWSCWPGRTWSAPGRSRPSGWRPTWARRRRRPSSSPATSTRTPRWTRRWRRGRSRCSRDAELRGRGRGVRRADRRGPGCGELAGPEAAAARRARRTGRLPGHRALRVLAGRPGQPAPGRLGAAPRAAGAGIDERLAARFAGRRRPGAAKLLVTARARCGCAGTGRSCSPGTGRSRPTGPRPAHAVAFAAVGVAGRGGHPAAGRARRRAAAGGHRAAAAGRRRGLDDVAHRHAPSTAPHLGSTHLLARYPVALLVRPCVRKDRRVADFAVWAPQRDRVRRGTVDGGTARDEPPTAAGWWRADAADAGHGARLRLPARRRRHARCPTRAPAGSPTACTARRQLYDHDDVLLDRPRRGPAASCPAACSTSCTSARSPPAGTFDAAIERLDHLAELGVDLVELLPVNAFDGDRNWGYDGVGWYAVHRDLRRPGRVQALRRRLPRARSRAWSSTSSTTTSARPAPTSPRSAPTSRAATPGARRSTSTAPAPSRSAAYIIDNALMWLRDFHVDGLRLDAVHALRDTPRHAPARAAGRSRSRRSPRTSGGRCR